MRIPILINPSAGQGRALRALEEAIKVLRHGGVEPEVLESRSAAHLAELAREVAATWPDMVVCAGGDGTVHHVLNGLFPSRVPLGILPIGRANDLARGLAIPSNPRDAAAILLKGKMREIDLARVHGGDHTRGEDGSGSAVYGSIAGVGFDSVVTRYANERARRLHGRFAYAWGILRCLRAYRPQPLELVSDEQNFSGDIMFAVVGNNTSYGDGVKMAPRARLDDGLLDVCIVPAMSKWELLRWAPPAYRGTHLNHPRIIYFQAQKVALRSPARLELFGDGEFLKELPTTIEAVPRALRVIVR